MKKRYAYILLLSTCLIYVFMARTPLYSKEMAGDIKVRYETGEIPGVPYEYTTFTLPEEKAKALQDILSEKVWYISSDWSSFFLSQNFVPEGEDMISLYLDSAMLTFSANGVVRDVSREKYAYFRFYQNEEIGQEIFNELYLLMEQQLVVSEEAAA